MEELWPCSMMLGLPALPPGVASHDLVARPYGDTIARAPDDRVQLVLLTPTTTVASSEPHQRRGMWRRSSLLIEDTRGVFGRESILP
jgi:hypothetical protein